VFPRLSGINHATQTDQQLPDEKNPPRRPLAGVRPRRRVKSQ
jgi:hypothetical protein